MATYSLELKLNTKKASDCWYLENYFREVAKISNTVRRFAMRRIERLKRDKNYRDLLAQYIKLIKQDKEKEKETVGKELSVVVWSYGLTKFYLQKSALDLRKNLRYVHSTVYQKICDQVWKGVEKVLYADGKRMHFKKWDDFLSFEGKSNTTGIIYQDGKVYINCTPKRPKGGIILSVKLPNNKNSDHWNYETRCLCDPTKYCRIVRKKFSSGWCYYVQLIQEGIPPQKHVRGTGRIGIDIGTSTVATVSETACHLDVLGDSMETKEKEIRRLQRKMDRSRRATNPQNYKEDGRVKKGKKRWAYSHHYQKMRDQLKTMRRKRTASLKQWQETYANRLLEEGDEVYVEDMSFKALKKRKKKTEKKENGRYKSKKRFGKSIGNHAPAQFLTIVKRKLDQTGGKYHEVNTRKFKASQYDHVTDTYTRKKLTKRHHWADRDWVQRDLYSAFLLMNSDKSLEHADRDLCLLHYPSFKILHDQCIEEIITSDKHIPASFGFHRAA